MHIRNNWGKKHKINSKQNNTITPNWKYHGNDFPNNNNCYIIDGKINVSINLDHHHHQQHFKCEQIYDTKCLHYIDWLVETRPSFSPPRRDLRPPGVDPGANEVYTERLDALNSKFQRLLEQLSQRLKTAVEVDGADGLVSVSFFLLLQFSNQFRNNFRVNKLQ